MNRESADRMIASVPVTKIRVGERSRALREDAIVSLVESIKTIGLQAPISVLVDSSSRDESYVLVAGLHRLEACRRLGMAHVDARIVELDETERRLWEISENLHRAELTALERSEHIAEWVRLSNERLEQSAQLALKGPIGEPLEKARNKPAQVAPVSERGGRGNTGGINAAVRELGIDRTEAQRAVKIDSLAPEAKAEAKALHLDHNQRALLDAAKVPSKEAIRALREEAARKAAPHDDAAGSERRLEAAMSAVRRLSQDELVAFADWFGAFRAERGEQSPGSANVQKSALPRWVARI